MGVTELITSVSILHYTFFSFWIWLLYLYLRASRHLNVRQTISYVKSLTLPQTQITSLNLLPLLTFWHPSFTFKF